MFPGHKTNSKLVYVALSVALLVIELEHIADFLWERSPLWARHLALALVPYVLPVTGGFALGLIYAVIFPGHLRQIRLFLQRRLEGKGA